MDISGRQRERAILQELLTSDKAEFVAIYGRRRVGKTFLVRQYVQPRVDRYFESTGQKDAPLTVQLHHFRDSLERAFHRPFSALASWDEALAALVDAVEAEPPDRRVALFLDELPWLATRRSGMLQALDYWWNSRLSRLPNLKLIVCGSAASWMLDKLLSARGGLHNRVTRQIALKPFTVPEASEFLGSRGSHMSLHQLVTLYMAVGGVPWYLEQVDPRHSAVQAIQSLCFVRDAPLRAEFTRLFASLFSDGPAYERIVRAVAARQSGILRTELIDALGLTSGGGLARRLSQLESAGFVAQVTPYDHKKRNVGYRVVDPYVFFFLRWIERAPSGVFEDANPRYWLDTVHTPAHRAWAGYAFETLAMQHAVHVKSALGFSDIGAVVGSWRYIPPAGSKRRGAQIDLLFDRVDGVVTLCELKHSADEFAVDKAYARELANKVEVFQQVSRTRKDVQLAMVTTHGLRRNLWSEDLVALDADVEDIFGTGY